MEGSGEKEKGLMVKDNSVGTMGGRGIKGSSGNEKHTITF